MNRRLVAIMIALSGCNRVFGLEDTTVQDSTLLPDGPRLVVPTDGSTSCAPPPDFETWNYARHSIAGFTQQVRQPSLVGPDRVLFDAADGSLYDSGTNAGAVRLRFPAGFCRVLDSPRASPSGDVIWFDALCPETAGIYYATRNGSEWLPRPTDLGLIGSVQPGAVAFYDGTARMMVGVVVHEGNGGVPSLVELSSHDGLSWTRLETFDRTLKVYSPALHTSGCFVLFDDFRNLYVSARGADGVFGPPSRLVKAGLGTEPTLDPTSSKLWFVNDLYQLVEATPP